MTAPAEQWRPIAGFPAYEVSDLGRVRSLDRTVKVTRAGGDCTYFLRGKVLKPTPGSHGYLQVTLCLDAVKSQRCVHALVAEAFIGPRPAGLNVLHRDGDQLNCVPSNLYYGDQVDNLGDAKRHGTTPAGERNGQAKLTTEEVRIIRKSPGLYEDIASRFDVTPSNIGMIKRRESWAGVE